MVRRLTPSTSPPVRTLGERLAPQQLLGAALILVGIAGASGAIVGRIPRRPISVELG